MTAARADDRYKWTVVALLWLTVFFNYADRQAIFSILPLLKRDFHLSNTELGLLGSVFLWVFTPVSPLAGYVGDRFNRKTVIVASLLIWSSVTCLTGLARSATQLFLLRAAMGLSEAAYFPAALAMISDYHGKGTRSRAVAIHGTGVNLGVLGGGALAAYLGEAYGWRGAFYLLGGLGILLVVVLQRGLAEAPTRQGDREGGGDGVPAPSRPSARQAMGTLAREPAAVLMMGSFLGVSAATWIFRGWMPFYLHEHFKMSLTMAGINATLYAELANLVAALGGGALADRLVRRTAAGRAAVPVAGLVFGAPFIALAGWTGSTGGIVVAMIGFGIAQGLYYANYAPALYEVVRPEVRATAIGVSNLAWGLGGGAATLLAGLLSEVVGWAWVLFGTALVYLLSAVLLAAGAWLPVRRGRAAAA